MFDVHSRLLLLAAFSSLSMACGGASETPDVHTVPVPGNGESAVLVFSQGVVGSATPSAFRVGEIEHIEVAALEDIDRCHEQGGMLERASTVCPGHPSEVAISFVGATCDEDACVIESVPAARPAARGFALEITAKRSGPVRVRVRALFADDGQTREDTFLVDAQM
jgi:hypothetical protein